MLTRELKLRPSKKLETVLSSWLWNLTSVYNFGIKKIEHLAREFKVIFPIHPRTLKMLQKMGYSYKNIQLLDPLSYLDFLSLEKYAKCVVTDSGGIQEETTYLGVPCITIRPNTERSITIKKGTNQLFILGKQSLLDVVKNIKNKKRKQIKFWDGKTSKRIVDCLFNSIKK